MDRRQFNQYALLAGALAPFLSGCQATEKPTLDATKATATPEPDFGKMSKAEAEQLSAKAHEKFMYVQEEHIAMLVYPGMALLDFIAPHFIFSCMMGAKIYVISSRDNLDPVGGDNALSFLPTHTQAQCPDKLDILFVPGGAQGTLDAMNNPNFIDFIKTKAAQTKYITSVCTGSFVLGKAGLLRGKKATSHWLTLPLLAKQGAIPVKQRVVWDGNIVTGGGVTAGIDFGLEIVAKLRGKTYAELAQLNGEYNPMPPFNSGSPDTASAFVRDNLRNVYAPFLHDLVLSM